MANAAGAACRTIVLDAGHGGEDGGAVSPDGVVESDLNLAITRRLRDVLLFLPFAWLHSWGKNLGVYS